MEEYSCFISTAVMESWAESGFSYVGVTVEVVTGGVVVCLDVSFFLQEIIARHKNKIGSAFFIKRYFDSYTYEVMLLFCSLN